MEERQQPPEKRIGTYINTLQIPEPEVICFKKESLNSHVYNISSAGGGPLHYRPTSSPQP